MTNLEKILTFIVQNEILAFDTETTGLNPRKHRIMGFGISNGYSGVYIPCLRYNAIDNTFSSTEYTAQDIYQILQALSTKKLITWNASFDMRFTKLQLGVNLLPALYADVLLLKHTCDEEFPFGLKEVAAQIFGKQVTDEKALMQESIKANGGRPTEYYKADETLLAKYCVQDCLLTFKLFNHYNTQLKNQGLEAFYYQDEVLPLYKTVTISMEERGVKLDVPLMQQSLLEIVASLQKCEQRIMTGIAEHLSTFDEWFLSKEYPLKSRGRLVKLMKEHNTDVTGARRLLWESTVNTSTFNLQSKHHLKKLFFDILGELPLSTTPTGLPQVDEEFITTMVPKHKWAQDLIDYNKLSKIKSTYIERLLNESEDGRFYPAFMQHRTVSGRYAGDLQQLPRPIKGTGAVATFTNRIREFILPDDGCTLCSADYQQLEPSIFAHASGDKALQAIFKSGDDFYSTVAIATEQLSFSAVKTDWNYLGAQDPEARQKAKIYALGIAYGLTSYKLKFEIGVSAHEADALVANYLKAYPALATFMAESKKEAYTIGRITSEAGRVRHLQLAKTLYAKYGPPLLDDLELWKAYNNDATYYQQAKADRRAFKNLLNNAINFKVQSFAASIMNKASIAIAQKLKNKRLKAVIVMQIHDQIVLNTPIEEINEVSVIVKDIMENIVQLAVPLFTDPIIGANFGKCK